MSEIEFTGTALPKAIAIFNKDWDLVGGSLFDEMQAMRKITTRPDYQRVIEKLTAPPSEGEIEAVAEALDAIWVECATVTLRQSAKAAITKFLELRGSQPDFNRNQGNDDN